MEQYTDKYGRYHDKPTDGVKPSSNNGWIYTAYAKQLDLPIDMVKLQECYKGCLVKNSMFYKIDRTPDKPTPPISRDEIIGLASLGLLNYQKLADQHHVFCNLPDMKPKKLSEINWFKALHQLWKLRNKNRNEVWQQEGYKEAQQIAFRLRPDDTYYIKRLYSTKPTLFEKVFFHVSSFFTRRGDSNSTKNIDMLQRHDLGKKIDSEKMLSSYIPYFGADHAFVKRLMND